MKTILSKLNARFLRHSSLSSATRDLGEPFKDTLNTRKSSLPQESFERVEVHKKCTGEVSGFWLRYK